MWSKLFLNRTFLQYGFIVVLIGFLWYRFHALHNQIEELENLITKKDLVITEQKLEIETRKNNELVLKNRIEKTNETIERMKIDEQKLKNEIKFWKNKKPEKVVQVVNKLVPDKTLTIENCKKVMENLKNLKYDEL